MKKPNFLGIGSVRGGSTWLHRVLQSHEAFYLPTYRKELQYFTRYHDKGDIWYFNFFKAQKQHQWVGEITPGYLIAPDAPKLIAEMGGIEKFVLILRHPVERIISHYKWHLRVSGGNPSFKEFYEGMPKLAINNSMYATNLNLYFDYFDPSRFLILIFEEAINNPQTAFKRLGEFFDVDESKFRLAKQVNRSTFPKYKKLFIAGRKLNSILKRFDLDGITNYFKQVGGMKLFGSDNEQSVNISKIDQQILLSQLRQEIEDIQSILGRDVESWKIINQEISK